MLEEFVQEPSVVLSMQNVFVKSYHKRLFKKELLIERRDIECYTLAVIVFILCCRFLPIKIEMLWDKSHLSTRAARS